MRVYSCTTTIRVMKDRDTRSGPSSTTTKGAESTVRSVVTRERGQLTFSLNTLSLSPFLSRAPFFPPSIVFQLLYAATKPPFSHGLEETVIWRFWFAIIIGECNLTNFIKIILRSVSEESNIIISKLLRFSDLYLRIFFTFY